MKVVVIGTGHVGLVTCATLAAIGHDVVGVDSDAAKITVLQGGGCPFYEPGLPDLVREQMDAGRLSFGNDVADYLEGADVAFICVGTPARADGEANLSAVERAARDVARSATGPMAVVEKSTVPAGTAQRIKRALGHERPDLASELDVVSNPEFLREGHAVKDSLEPDRILVGAESERAFGLMRRLYAPIVEAGYRMIETDIQTAELAKHACNAFLALKISYINALARLCESAGADVTDVADVMGADDRIGRAFLNAGLGYGGYCFPKDIQAFERLAARLGYDFPLLNEVSRINDQAVEAAFEKVKDAMWNLEGKRVALLGLSFKPGTDDVRFSPALALARLLLAEGAHVVGYDPQAADNARSELPEIGTAGDAYEAAEGAHCTIIATEWEEIVTLDLARLRELMAYPVIVDARNALDAKTVAESGFTYYRMGAPPLA
jgi:UDPglucose 6-dehydrogenase